MEYTNITLAGKYFTAREDVPVEELLDRIHASSPLFELKGVGVRCGDNPVATLKGYAGWEMHIVVKVTFTERNTIVVNSNLKVVSKDEAEKLKLGANGVTFEIDRFIKVVENPQADIRFNALENSFKGDSTLCDADGFIYVDEEMAYLTADESSISGNETGYDSGTY